MQSSGKLNEPAGVRGAFGHTHGSLLGWCGAMGIIGSAAMVVSNIVGSAVVPDYDWVSDSISDLAAGRGEIIQDVGLYAYAGSLIALALGTANAHPGTNRWSLGVIGLALMAALLVVIGARNEYGDRDAVHSWGVHIGLVYTLMLLFLGTVATMARDMRRAGSAYRRLALVWLVLFVISDAVYFLAPTSQDGLVERLVGLVTIGWVVTVSVLLLRVRRFVRD